MTKLLFIDCETTGVDPLKARLVELAAIFVDTQANGGLVSETYSTLVHQEEPIPAQATAIHGITTEQCAAEGVPLCEALAHLTDMVLKTREPESPYHYTPGVTNRLVAHNLRYDMGVLASEYRRSEAKIFPLNYLSPFCTMQSLTDRMKLPGKFGKYKWPRLEEAWLFCGRPLTNGHIDGQAHRALYDTTLCKEIYFHGLRQGWWSHD